MDLILISDYGKGLVSRNLIAELVKIAKHYRKLTIADPKGLDFTKYSGVSLLTPNSKEASRASGVEITDEKTVATVGNILMEKSGIERLLITCGKDGMVLFEPGSKPFKISTKARDVYDVSGAGDTVMAVLGLGMAAPLLLFSYSGGARTLMPRPGPWMETLKQFLAFPLYGAAIWLLWVAGRQTGVNTMATAMGVAPWKTSRPVSSQ